MPNADRRPIRVFRAFGGCCLLALFRILLPAPSSAQEEDFAAWLARDQAESVAYSDAVTRQYEAYVAAQRKAFEDFVSQVGEKWGRANVWVPEQKVWVQYTNRFEERSSVDFENGKVRVQILLPAGAKLDPVARSRMVGAPGGTPVTVQNAQEAAAAIVAAMPPDQVYAHLRSSLPYQETRDYVKRVSDRIPLYEAWR
jgi:hypothetical protein